MPWQLVRALRAGEGGRRGVRGERDSLGWVSLSLFIIKLFTLSVIHPCYEPITHSHLISRSHQKWNRDGHVFLLIIIKYPLSTCFYSNTITLWCGQLNRNTLVCQRYQSCNNVLDAFRLCSYQYKDCCPWRNNKCCIHLYGCSCYTAVELVYIVKGS